MVLKLPPFPENDAPTTERGPIGVGPDYKPEYHGQTQDPAQTKVRYYSGAERELIAGMSREDIADLQLTLRDLGLIGPKTRIKLAVWDNTSAEAFRQVLAMANTNGVGWRAALAQLQADAEYGSIGDDADTKLPPNPLDLQAAAREAGTRYLGGPLTAEQSSQLQTGLSSQMMADNVPGAAGQQEYLRQKTRSFDPVRFDARSAVKVASVISRMLGGDLPSEKQQLPSEGG